MSNDPLLARLSSPRPLLSLAVLLAITTLVFYGCRTHYTVETYEDESRESIASLNEALQDESRFVLIGEDWAYGARQVRLADDSLVVTLTPVEEFQTRLVDDSLVVTPVQGDDKILKLLEPGGPNTGTRWRQPIESARATGVRIHLDAAPQAGVNEEVTIPFTDIAQIDVVNIDTGKTTASYVLGTVGFVAATAVVLAALVLLTKDSCPFVYADDGTGLALAGELFGGAIAPSLERSDYLPLRNVADRDGYLHVRIANQLLEREYINVAQLAAVAHPVGTEVLMDKSGVVHTIEDARPPQAARSNDGRDYTTQLQAPDWDWFAFQDGEGATSAIELTFDRPDAASSGKLIVHAKSSYWLEYVFDRYTEQFGVLYDRWTERIASRTPGELEQWALAQSLPLSVYVETPDGWVSADHFDMVGPLAGTREMVLPLDLSGVEGDRVRVKLETGFAFWELDAAAMDFTMNRPVEVTYLAPEEAVTTDGKDVGPLLAHDDDHYLEQFEVGDAVDLRFQVPTQRAGWTMTPILHGKGYYEPIRSYSGIPDLAHLYRFTQAGTFTAFAKDQLDKHTTGLRLTAAHAP